MANQQVSYWSPVIAFDRAAQSLSEHLQTAAGQPGSASGSQKQRIHKSVIEVSFCFFFDCYIIVLGSIFGLTRAFEIRVDHFMVKS